MLSNPLTIATTISARPRRRTYLIPPRIPAPSHRHAAPSGPWPYDDEGWHDEGLDSASMPLGTCDHSDCEDCKQWISYPQSLFPNWKLKQVRKSGLERAIQDKYHEGSCVIHKIDVLKSGAFEGSSKHAVDECNKREFWKILKKQRRPNIRVRAVFVDNMSGPVLQMLGTTYNIEPFFFTSSINWIPSRNQQDILQKQGDHITITLTFLRSIPRIHPKYTSTLGDSPTSTSPLTIEENNVIDTQAPLVLHSNRKVILLDILAVHMVRDHESSTIISYHPPPEWFTTSAQTLHTRMRYAGESVYWQKIFRASQDPTFVLLAILWHALYAWDETIEDLYSHFCWLESQVISTSEILLTQELHIIRAHLLHHTSLLEDFRKSVQFVLDTSNPAMDADSVGEEERDKSRALLKKECSNLLSEIERLEMSRTMQDRRLQNVMDLVFATVTIGDSKDMQKLTEHAVRDSAAMKQIAFLTMLYLPPSFIAAVFGMNVKEFSKDTEGTLPHYTAFALPLTVITIWVIVAFQSKYHVQDAEANFWMRLWWPITWVINSFYPPKRISPEEEQMERSLYAKLPDP